NRGPLEVAQCPGPPGWGRCRNGAGPLRCRGRRFEDTPPEYRVLLLSPLAPKPDSQSRQDDEGQDADPERYADIPRSHFHPEEDAKQLGESDQPEEDRRYKRRWSLAHLTPFSSRRMGGT